MLDKDGVIEWCNKNLIAWPVKGSMLTPAPFRWLWCINPDDVVHLRPYSECNEKGDSFTYVYKSDTLIEPDAIVGKRAAEQVEFSNFINRGKAIEWCNENISYWPTTTRAIKKKPEGWCWYKTTDGSLKLIPNHQHMEATNPAILESDCSIRKKLDLRRVRYYEWHAAPSLRPHDNVPFYRILAGEGYFHAWGVEHEQYDDAVGNNSIAIIELDDGTIAKPDILDVEFIL